jgi:hypothetical protein
MNRVISPIRLLSNVGMEIHREETNVSPRTAAFTAAIRSRPILILKTYASAPACLLNCIISGSVSAEQITMQGFDVDFVKCRATSIPLTRGILRSRTTISGRYFRMRLSASKPFSAVATTANSVSIRPTIRLKSAGLSSAITTFN